MSFFYMVSAAGTTGATSGTIVPIALKQATRGLTIKEVGFTLGGTAVASALTAQLNIYSSASSGGGTAVVGKWTNQSIPAAQTSARTLDTAQGTLVANGPQWLCQPLGGFVDVQYPLDVEPGMDGAVSDYIGLAVVTTATSYPFTAFMIFQET